MSKRDRKKGGDSKLRQTTMGDFMSKQDKSAKTQSTKRKVKSRMFSSFWTRGSQRDTEEYRNGYPGKKDHEALDDNYRFYTNQIPSKPDGDFIDNIHAQWADDYRKLERHHGYIQWLFPIRESGMNWHAQELQLHEIKKITSNKKAKARVLKSYEMMLGFYGMQLVNKEDGTIERADNWKERFQHLNRSFHNYLRITRILKSLGELGYEHLKANFVRFVLNEGMVEDTLPNVIESCVKFWIGVIKNDNERQELIDLFGELNDAEDDKKPRNMSPELSPDSPRRTRNSRQYRQIIIKSDSEDETLENDLNLIDDEHEKEKDKKAKRKDHDLSESDEDQSQEMQHWNENEKEDYSIDVGSDDADVLKADIKETNVDEARINVAKDVKLDEEKDIADKNGYLEESKDKETKENKDEVLVKDNEKMNDNSANSGDDKPKSGENQGARKENEQVECSGDEKDMSKRTKATNDACGDETECQGGGGDICEEPCVSKNDNETAKNEDKTDTENEAKPTEPEAMDTSTTNETPGCHNEASETAEESKVDNTKAEENENDTIRGTKMDTE